MKRIWFLGKDLTQTKERRNRVSWSLTKVVGLWACGFEERSAFHHGNVRLALAFQGSSSHRTIRTPSTKRPRVHMGMTGGN